MRLLAEETAAVLIDVQERLLPHMEDQEQLLARCLLLVRGLRLLGVPLLVTEQYPKGLGPTVPALASELSAPALEKISFSCCEAAEFPARLAALGRKNVVVAGIEAHVCVLQTVLDLPASGYTPVVAVDCISSRRAGDRRVACRRMEAEGAVLTTSESLLFELCRRAGSPVFREISRLVR